MGPFTVFDFGLILLIFVLVGTLLYRMSRPVVDDESEQTLDVQNHEGDR